MLGDCVEKITNRAKPSGEKKNQNKTTEIEAKTMKVPLFQDFPPAYDLEKAAGGPGELHPPETA